MQFDREIVQILDRHCVMCHVDNGPAFPLVTYEQTYAVRRMMRMDALDRHMSPWAAVPGYGEFANDNGLTLREIDFIVSWAEGWGPRNTGAVYTGVADVARPKVIQAKIDFGLWELGKPDLLLQLSSNTIEAQQADQTRRTVVSTGLTTDRWLRGLEYKPSDHRVVRAAFFTVEETGQWIGSWTPWYGFASLPKGLAYRLPAGSHIVAELHYCGSKERVDEHGSLGLFFADQPSRGPVSDVTLQAKAEASEVPGSAKFHAVATLPADANVLALKPEIRPGAKSIEVSARTPDGGTRVLLFAKDFPTDWPTPYIFKNPVALPKDTKISVSEYYGKDGSEPNVAIPLTISAYLGPAVGHEEEAAPATISQQPGAATPKTSPKRFKLEGEVRSVDAEQGTLMVHHGDIPGFMGAMTMRYDAGKKEDLTKLSSGDQIQADVVVSGDDTHLENIKVIAHAKGKDGK